MKIKRPQEIPQIVYHGTTTEYIDNFDKIDLTIGRKDLDFGQGFYTTSVKKQAIEWAYGKTWRNFRPFILTYKVNFDKMKLMKGKIFTYPSNEWARFIYKHRMEIFDDSVNYDYIYGHTADGKIQLLIEEIKNRTKTYEDFKKEIFPRECKVFYYDQLFFRTELSITALEKINVEVL